MANNKRNITNAPLLGKVGNKLSLVVKDKSITWDKLSDGLKEYIESKGSGESPADLNEIISSIVREQLISVNARLDSIEAVLTDHENRIRILEGIPIENRFWYVGQYLDNYIEGETRPDLVWSALDATALIRASERIDVTTKRKDFVINKPIWFAMIPVDMTLKKAGYTADNISSELSWSSIREWPKRLPHDEVLINGVRYSIYASFNAALKGYNAPAYFELN